MSEIHELLLFLTCDVVLTKLVLPSFKIMVMLYAASDKHYIVNIHSLKYPQSAPAA